MTKVRTILAVLKAAILAMLIWVVPANGGSSGVAGNTIVFYESSHGIQVEYYSPAGKAYLWYPGNRSVVRGKWKISNGSTICYKYGGNTYNPVTNTRGGSWECNSIQVHSRTKKFSCKGDVFSLSSGRIPYVLKRSRFGLARLKRACS